MRHAHPAAEQKRGAVEAEQAVEFHGATLQREFSCGYQSID
jgi:hypothetical protein